jgi:hypothetical protein
MVRVTFEHNYTIGHNYTIDTCVGIKICENANVGNLLSCRIDFTNSTIHLSSQTVLEANRLGYDVDAVSKQIGKSTGAKVVFGSITGPMIGDAEYLERQCPTLHSGDSSILAYVRATGTTLITCDRGLAEAATVSGTKVINPDLLPCDAIESSAKSKYTKLVRRVIAKPVTATKKAKSLILKPGQKIIWRSFQ